MKNNKKRKSNLVRIAWVVLFPIMLTLSAFKFAFKIVISVLKLIYVILKKMNWKLRTITIFAALFVIFATHSAQFNAPVHKNVPTILKHQQTQTIHKNNAKTNVQTKNNDKNANVTKSTVKNNVNSNKIPQIYENGNAVGSFDQVNGTEMDTSTQDEFMGVN